MEKPDYLSLDFLSGGGEMGERIRSVDWANTPLGTPETWSPALRATLALVLNNRFPMLLWWTKDYISLYNDAYIPVLGAKHPWGLGLPVRECWEEIWNVLQPLIDTPFNGGESTWMEDIQLIINRKNYDEETHFVIAYSPVPDGTTPNGIGGVLATVNEITNQVISARALGTLSKISAEIVGAQSEKDVYEKVALALSENRKDFPFCIIHKIDETASMAHLYATGGIDNSGFGLTPSAIIDLKNQSADPLSIAKAVEEGTILHSVFDDSWKDLPKGEWEIMPKEFVHIPIKTVSKKLPQAILTIGLNPYRRFDDSYRQFVQLAAEQISTGLMNALALDEEKKRLEALAEIDRAKTTFFANVSHELRTPLTLLLSPAEEMINAEHRLSPQDIQKNHEIIYRNGRRLLKLVNSLLEFSSIEAGKIDARFSPADLSGFTRDVASGFRSVVEKAGLSFNVKCDILSQPVYVDREMWEKIVLNLLSNAFKFTLNGHITINLREEKEGVSLQVTDSGIGIPEKELPQMFQRFHRIEGSGGRTHEGTGIGLSLVYELVKLHKGDIRVDSHLGKGSTFTVYLPYGSSHLEQQSIAAPGSQPSSNKLTTAFLDEANALLPQETETTAKKAAAKSAAHANGTPLLNEDFTVLIVDDNGDMRDYLGRILSPHWNVLFAENGEAAMDMIRKKAPDLIVSDLMMPLMNGTDLLQQVRSEFRLMRIPFILLSARAGEESKIEGLELGADDYIIKPFSANELRAKVQTQLDANKAKNQAEKYLKQLFTSAPIALCMLKGPSFEIELANERMLKIWGKEIEEVRDRSLYEVLPPDAHAGLELLLDAVVRSGRTCKGEEMVIESDLSKETVINYVAEPLTDERGSIHSIVLLAHEITDLVEARKSAVANANELRRLMRQKDEFISVASHELKTPVTSIKAILQVLHRMQVPDARVTDFIERAGRQVLRLSSLVNDLLDVSALEAGKANFSFAEFDFDEMIAEAVQEHLQIQHTHQIIVVNNDKAKIKGDRNRLEQVVSNLLSNAIKYSPKANKVQIESTFTEGAIKVTVEDFGIGIPEDKLDKVFERFYRVEKESRNYQGMGLGLHISSEIIKRHNGTIKAERKPKGGSIFWFEVPVGV